MFFKKKTNKRTPSKHPPPLKLYACHFFSVYYYNQSPFFLLWKKENEGISFLAEL